MIQQNFNADWKFYKEGEETKKILACSREECDKMLQAARGRLERTAQWIAEEVVNDKWQS